MKTKKKLLYHIYLGIIILSSVPLVYLSAKYCIAYFSALDVSLIKNEVIELSILIIIAILCKSLPIYVREDEAVEISIIPILASMLLKGVWITLMIAFISCIFLIEVPKNKDKKISHIFNTPIYKTLFNTSNLLLSILLGYWAYNLLGGVPGDLTIPAVFLPMAGFLITTFVSSTVIISILMLLIRDVKEKGLFISNILLSLLPSLIATAPIGLFIAYVFSMDSGAYLSILFILPLFFARYAFGLYLDSKTQLYKIIRTLTATIEAKDQYTKGHSERVEDYSLTIARYMSLPTSEIERIRIASVLHDIGKIGIADTILRKPGKLDEDEWVDIKKHPQIGINILSGIDMPPDVKDIIFYHHMYYDGYGYPQSEQPPTIPLGAYIIGVADSYDAMTSDRPYRKAMDKSKSISIIKSCSGTQFHPDVVEAFIAAFNNNEI